MNIWLVENLFKHPKRIGLVSLVVPIIGFFWQLLTPADDSIALSRSGALLVMFAITAVFFNHILGETRHITENITKLDLPIDKLKFGLAKYTRKKVARKIGEELLKDNDQLFSNSVAKYTDLSDDEESRGNLAELMGEAILEKNLSENPSLFEDSVGDNAAVLSKRAIQAKNELPVLDKTRSNISHAEFWIGLIGTFIWGFGDILYDFTIFLAII